MILGDFNGHVGVKGSFKKLDENGKILDCLKNYSLIMSNVPCNEEIT